MKTKIIIILIVTSVTNIFAQSDSLNFPQKIEYLNTKVNLLEKQIQKIYENQISKQEFEEIKNQNETSRKNHDIVLKENTSLKNSQKFLKRNYKKLNYDFENYKKLVEKELGTFKTIIGANTSNIQSKANELGVKIDDSYQNTNQSINDLNKTVSQNTLYWIIAILVVALLVLLVFLLLKKQIFKHKIDLDSNLQDTRRVLEEEGVKLDNKLIEVLETQLKIINSNSLDTEKEADHTLALKVADEIIRIQNNLTQMDEKTRGLKQLTKSVIRIQDNFASNGYEIVKMIGKIFDSGMKASPTYNPESKEKSGIITRIIKPQVNYKGKMIQSAQIEVSE